MITVAKLDMMVTECERGVDHHMCIYVSLPLEMDLAGSEDEYYDSIDWIAEKELELKRHFSVLHTWQLAKKC